jgi:hypothetical protein
MMATHAAELGRPVLFIVDADPAARRKTASALVRRFGPGYQVLSAALRWRAWMLFGGFLIAAVRGHWWRLICGCPT